MFRGRTVLLLLLVTVLATSGLTIYVMSENSNIIQANTNLFGNETTEVPQEMDKLVEAYNKILETYIDDEPKGELIDGAIQGMVQTLDDPHSSYMNAEQAEDFFSALSDSFEGIGAEVTMENGKVTVTAPIKGSPSEKAGVKPRDQILKVNGESLEGLDLFEAVSKIRGPKGTDAVLEISRPGLSEPITITVTRDEIPIETVHSETIPTKEGLIGKIEITNFGEKTAAEFEDALKKLEKQNIEGLIIDLRGNPGGYLQSVIDIGNLVIPNKGTIVQIEDKDGNRKAYNSTMDEAKYPIVTIIDGGSASASEILSAALQEAGNYPVVGETSYGKGTVQNPFELSDGSNIKLTVAKWLTSDGNWIHEKGVQPDVKVGQPEYYYTTPFPEDVNLKLDMNDENVKNLQIMLDGLGYMPKRTDGYFDKNTEEAVKAFEKVHGLEVNGIVEPETANKLQDEIINKIKDPKSDMQLQVAIETLLKMIK